MTTAHVPEVEEEAGNVSAYVSSDYKRKLRAAERALNLTRSDVIRLGIDLVTKQCNEETVKARSA